MRVFLSYARPDRDRVLHMAEDLREMGHAVWMDQQLSGGQDWWHDILAQVQACDVVIIALSDAWLASLACTRELQWANATVRRVLPVRVGQLAWADVPTALRALQSEDYTAPDARFMRLVRALNKIAPPPQVPDPIPNAPPPPPDRDDVLYALWEQLRAPSLAEAAQGPMLLTLGALLDAPSPIADNARVLLAAFAAHASVTHAHLMQATRLLSGTPATDVLARHADAPTAAFGAQHVARRGKATPAPRPLLPPEATDDDNAPDDDDDAPSPGAVTLMRRPGRTPITQQTRRAHVPKAPAYSQLDAHRAAVTTLVWSPDGRTLASGGADHLVVLWPRAQHQRAQVLPGHLHRLLHLAWSPDGARLASASSGAVLRLWHADGTPIARMTGHKNSISALAWSPDGVRLASASWDGCARLWNARGEATALVGGRTGLLNQMANAVFDTPNTPVLALAWHPAGDRIATAQGTALRVCTVEGRTQHATRLHTGVITALAWSPDGTTLASAGRDRLVQLWSPLTQKAVALHGSTSAVGYLAWSPDGARLAYASTMDVRVFHVGQRAINLLSGHSGMVTGLAWSPDGARLATTASDNTVRLWSPGGTALGAPLPHETHVNALAWSADGALLATGTQDGTIRLWQVG